MGKFELTVREEPFNHDLNKYPLIGEGVQGKVYRISLKRCVKIYAEIEYAEMEFRSYRLAGDSPILPRLYEKGLNYLVMEYFRGPSLDEYLPKKGAVERWVTRQVLEVLAEMRRLRFIKIDANLRHLFIEKHNVLKTIDLVNAYSAPLPVPVRMLGDLYNLGFLPAFLQQVREIDPLSYQEFSSVTF